MIDATDGSTNSTNGANRGSTNSTGGADAKSALIHHILMELMSRAAQGALDSSNKINELYAKEKQDLDSSTGYSSGQPVKSF